MGLSGRVREPEEEDAISSGGTQRGEDGRERGGEEWTPMGVVTEMHVIPPLTRSCTGAIWPSG